MNNTHNSGISKTGYIMLVLAGISIGIYLRLYKLNEQIILDDEWHGIFYTLKYSFWYIITHFDPDASSIPYNVYRQLTYNFTGWSETILRIPSVLAGIISIGLFTWIVRIYFNKQTALIFLFFLSVSPFLIFLSRYSRVYSPRLLFEFIAFFSFYGWVTGMGIKCRNVYIVFSILAVYCHLYSLPVVLAPLIAVATLKLSGTRNGNLSNCVQGIISIPGLIRTVLYILAGCGLLLAVAAYNSLDLFLSARLGLGTITIDMLSGVTELFTGTSSPGLNVLFACFLAVGICALLKENRLFVVSYISVAITCLLVFFITRPVFMEAPVMFARYAVLLIPLTFIAVAAGINKVIDTVMSLNLSPLNLVSKYIFIPVILLFYIYGPLPHIYSGNNNFTNHLAYQESYKGVHNQMTYTSAFYPENMKITVKQIPEFYSILRADTADYSVVEYPVTYMDHDNFFYFYQRFTNKKVISGYYPEIMKTYSGNIKSWDEFASLFGTSNVIGGIIGVFGDSGRFKFRNHINILDVDRAKRMGAKYIVLHKNVDSEKTQSAHRGAYTYIAGLKSELSFKAGNPVYEDDWIIVFDINPDNRVIPK